MTDSNNQDSVAVQLAVMNTNIQHLVAKVDEQREEQRHDAKAALQKFVALEALLQRKADKTELESQLAKMDAERQRLLKEVKEAIALKASQEDFDTLEKAHGKVAEKQDDYVQKGSLKPILWAIAIAMGALLTGLGTDLWGGISKAIWG